MTTIKDVAREVGVSTATVSMVINDKKGISQKTEKKVRKAIRKLNYVGNVSAKTLVTKKSRTIGLVVGSLNNSYFTEIISSVEDIARKYGYSVFICDAERNTQNALKSFDALMSRGVDGIIFSLSITINDGFVDGIRKLKESGIAVTSLTRCMGKSEVPIVSFLDQEEIYELVLRVVKLGHRKIGAIGAPEGSWLNEYRLEIFRRVLREWDLLDEEFVTYSQMTIKHGKETAMRLLKDHSEITAIFGINDVVAIGAMQAAKELGMRIPEDVSIIGNDGIPVGELITPVLTTVVTPREKIGQLATEKIIQQIENIEQEDNTVTLLPCSIREGKSLAEPRNENGH